MIWTWFEALLIVANHMIEVHYTVQIHVTCMYISSILFIILCRIIPDSMVDRFKIKPHLYTHFFYIPCHHMYDFYNLQKYNKKKEKQST